MGEAVRQVNPWERPLTFSADLGLNPKASEVDRAAAATRQVDTKMASLRLEHAGDCVLFDLKDCFTNYNTNGPEPASARFERAACRRMQRRESEMRDGILVAALD